MSVRNPEPIHKNPLVSMLENSFVFFEDRLTGKDENVNKGRLGF